MIPSKAFGLWASLLCCLLFSVSAQAQWSLGMSAGLARANGYGLTAESPFPQAHFFHEHKLGAAGQLWAQYALPQAPWLAFKAGLSTARHNNALVFRSNPQAEATDLRIATNAAPVHAMAGLEGRIPLGSTFSLHPRVEGGLGYIENRDMGRVDIAFGGNDDNRRLNFRQDAVRLQHVASIWLRPGLALGYTLPSGATLRLEAAWAIGLSPNAQLTQGPITGTVAGQDFDTFYAPYQQGGHHTLQLGYQVPLKARAQKEVQTQEGKQPKPALRQPVIATHTGIVHYNTLHKGSGSIKGAGFTGFTQELKLSYPLWKRLWAEVGAKYMEFGFSAHLPLDFGSQVWKHRGQAEGLLVLPVGLALDLPIAPQVSAKVSAGLATILPRRPGIVNQGNVSQSGIDIMLVGDTVFKNPVYVNYQSTFQWSSIDFSQMGYLQFCVQGPLGPVQWQWQVGAQSGFVLEVSQLTNVTVESFGLEPQHHWLTQTSNLGGWHSSLGLAVPLNLRAKS